MCTHTHTHTHTPSPHACTRSKSAIYSLNRSVEVTQSNATREDYNQSAAATINLVIAAHNITRADIAQQADIINLLDYNEGNQTYSVLNADIIG